MLTTLFLLMFFGLLICGMPIFLVLGVCATALFMWSGQPLIGVASKIIDELNSTTLMALPLFVMAAAFMRRGGVARALVDFAAAMLLVMPILAPALLPIGVDPVHFSIVFTHNMEIALVHPPVGLNLYVLATISDAPIGEVIRGILPFLLLLLVVLGIITYVPELSLWLPHLIYGR